MHLNTHVNIDTCTHGGCIHMGQITPSHTRSQTLPPLTRGHHTPSHPRSLTHPSDVSSSKMPAGSMLIALPPSSRFLGTRRGGSQPSHTPPAHARCVHQHAHAWGKHAHAPCTRTCAPWFIHSLHLRALCMRERMCMRVRKCMHLYS